MDMMRVNLTLPDPTLAAMDKRLEPFKRSQFVAYAARALLARLDGDLVNAVGYEHAAKMLLATGGRARVPR